MKIITVACVSALLLSACTGTIRPDPIKVKIPGATIESGSSGGGSHGGKFCPPGQAKKGNC